MYFGITELGGSQPVWCFTTTDGVTTSAPDGDVLLDVYEEGSGTKVVDGTTMTEVVTDELYRHTLTVSTGNGFSRGNFLCYMRFAVSSAAKRFVGSFTVV